MDIGELIFYALGFVWLISLARLGWMNFKIGRRIKEHYPKFWGDNMLVLFVGSRFAKNLIPKLLKEVDDPVMRLYQKQWERAFRQLLLAVFISIVIFIGYIAIFVGF